MVDKRDCAIGLTPKEGFSVTVLELKSNNLVEIGTVEFVWDVNEKNVASKAGMEIVKNIRTINIFAILFQDCFFIYLSPKFY